MGNCEAGTTAQTDESTGYPGSSPGSLIIKEENMKGYITKRRNGYYKYRSYYEKGERKQQYLGKASLFERIIYKIKRRFK